RHQAGVGLPVVRAERAARDVVAQRWIATAQCGAFDNFQAQAEVAHFFAVGRQLFQVGLRPCQLQMPRPYVFGIGAYELGQPAPDTMCALREVQLLGWAALAAHAAEIDPAGLGAATPSLN